MSKQHYKNISGNTCHLICCSSVCSSKSDCEYCAFYHRERDFFDITHTIEEVNITDCICGGKNINVIVQLIIQNKTNEIINDLSIKETALIGFSNIVTDNVYIVENYPLITTIDTDNVDQNFICSGELLIPEFSSLNPGEKFTLVYTLKYIDWNSNLKSQFSYITIKGSNTNYFKSKTEIILDYGCITQVSPPQDIYDGFCNNISNKCDEGVEVCYEYNNNNIIGYDPFIEQSLGDVYSPNGILYLDNFILKEGDGDIYISFNYEIISDDWELTKAYAITGNNTKICIFNFSEGDNLDIKGTFNAPIGRPFYLNTTNNDISKYVIRFLKFCLIDKSKNN
jgi:hypothetical protein